VPNWPLAHARRKFFERHVSNKSQIAHSALAQIGRVYDIERGIKDLPPGETIAYSPAHYVRASVPPQ